jgi:EF-hand domain pair
LKEYFLAHPELLPAKGQYINIHSSLMKFFARGMFRMLWEATGELIPDPEEVAEDYSHPVNMDRVEGRLRLSVLDRDNDGFVTVDDIHYALRDFLGLSVEDDYKHLARQVHNCADITGNGMVTVEDFEIFCRDGMPSELTMHARWEDAFPDPLTELSPEVLERITEASASPTTASDSDDGASPAVTSSPVKARGKESEATMATMTSSTSANTLPPTEIDVHPIDF